MAKQGSDGGNGGDEQQSPTLLDLNKLNNPGYELKYNSRDTPEDAIHRRKKDFLFFIFCLMGVCATFFLSIWLIMSTRSSSNDKEFGFKLLTLIIGAFLGFLVGKKT